MMIKERIKSLKTDLIRKSLSFDLLFQKHIVDVTPYYFSTVLNDLSMEYKVREMIADTLGVHINEVVVIGSAKLGYSLNPKKMYLEFDSKYNQTRIARDKSDIDVAVISTDLFRMLNINLYNFTNSFKNRWEENEYYSGDQLKDFKVPINYKFYEYHVKGWFRPDFKPRGFEFCVNRTYEKLKKEIIDLTGRKLSLAIYKNWFFFKNYHIENLKRMQNSMQTEV